MLQVCCDVWAKSSIAWSCWIDGQGGNNYGRKPTTCAGCVQFSISNDGNWYHILLLCLYGLGKLSVYLSRK